MRKNLKYKNRDIEIEKHKLNETGSLGMKYKKWNKLNKSKRLSYSLIDFKCDCSLETYLDLWRKKKKQYLGICIFQKFQDNSDMHLDFKKWS